VGSKQLYCSGVLVLLCNLQRHLWVKTAHVLRSRHANMHYLHKEVKVFLEYSFHVFNTLVWFDLSCVNLLGALALAIGAILLAFQLLRAKRAI
jgi:hypothetical protein